MKKRLIIPLSILIYWILFAIFYKLVFLIYQSYKGQDLNFTDYFKVIAHGFRMDLSMSSYMTLFPALLVVCYFFFPSSQWKKILSVYMIIVILFFTLLTVIDLELYVAWGYRLDNSFFRFLSTPKEVMASTAASPIVLLTVLYILLSTLSIYLYLKFIAPYWDDIPKDKDWKGSLTNLIIAALLVIPIRGGLQQHPINESVAYFSPRAFLNHAAVNMPWTFFRSITNTSDVNLDNLVFMDKEEANKIFHQLHPHTAPDSILLNRQKPNIVLIIWESLAYQISDTGATPQFNKLKKEGIYFSNLYANADRSDKGLVSILSGQPAIPGLSLMADPRRTAQMSSLCQTLRDNQYSQTTFLYGGDLEFANIRAYMTDMGFEKLIGKMEFPSSQWNSKWGAQDQYTYDRLYSEITSKKETPFFITLFTLSSHEPFDVPAKPVYAGHDEATQFMNAHHYSDSCLGDFIFKIKQTPYWNNTLFIIVGDHGHRLPRHSYFHNNDTTEFHTPMLWLGGVVNHPGIVNPHFGTQSDISASLLGQMKISADAFIYSKDLFSSKSGNFAQYAFRDGFGWVSPKGALRYDRNSAKYLEENPLFITSQGKSPFACMQYLIDNYRDK